MPPGEPGAGYKYRTTRLSAHLLGGAEEAETRANQVAVAIATQDVLAGRRDNPAVRA